MKVIYSIELRKKGAPDSGAYTELCLPATPYELLDVQDRLRLKEGESMWWRITNCYRFRDTAQFLSGEDLYAVNTLVQKLSELDGRQCTAFAGLLQMEQAKGGPGSISRLIDLAYSTGCCHVVDEALDDFQLGQFCAKSGFVPGVEELPDTVFDLLDFEQIGREHRQREGGVLVECSADHPGGYVEQHSGLVEAHKGMDLMPKVPDYTILLKAEDGTQWKLPSSSLPEGQYTCLDCRVPDLISAISDAEDITSIQRVAQRLADMEPEELNKFKALFATADFPDLDSAEQLMDTLDQYIFSPQFSSPIEVAKGELSNILAELEAEIIIPHLNLYQYGQALIEKCGGVLTDYGLIARKDRQPVQAMEDQPQQGGMEMC